MCYFITVAVHEEYVGRLQERLRGAYTISRSSNPSLRNLFPEHSIAYEVVTGMCSCDLYAKPQDIEKEAENIRKKYRKPKYKKNGWTEAKIARTVNDRITSIKQGGCGLDQTLRTALCDIVAESHSLALVVHWYAGDVGKEQFRQLPVREVCCDELRQDDRAVEEDVIIRLKK